ncbi:MAG TPA: PilN domain-containing protein [candidate division Zixibacteria bacterium]
MNKNREESKVDLLSKFKDNKFFYFLRYNMGSMYLDALRGVETSYALEIDSDNLRLVRANKKDDKVLGIKTDAEPIENLSQSISALFSRHHYSGEEVFISVSGIDFLNKIVEVDLEKNQTVEDWIIKNKDKVFPPTGDEEIEFDYVILEDNERKLLYVSIVRQNRLEQLRQILKENYLNVSSISSGSLGLYHFLKRNEEVARLDKLVLVLLKDKSAEITFLRKGVPVFTALAGLTEQKEELVSNIRNLMQLYCHSDERTENWKFLILGEGNLASSYEHAFEKAGLSLLEQSWLQKHLDERSVPSTHVIPFSLVDKSGGSISKATTNLLFSHNRLDGYTKSIARVFGYSLKAFLLLLIVLGIFNIGFALFDSLNKDKVKGFESKLETLNDLKQENQILEEKWGKLSQMLLNRSGESRLLYLISKYRPEGVWLRSISSESISSNQRTEIAGLAVSQAGVSGFFRNLEESNLFEDVKLLYLDRVETTELTKLPAKYKEALFKFKIQFQSKS